MKTGYPDAAELYVASRLVASPCLNWSAGLASVGRMPARPHRTVDRVVEILETVSLSQRGVTLAELATAMGAAKSSVQELTNGLLARGYLIEEDRRFHLGPGPFILAARANKLAALSLNHEFVVEVSKMLGCTVLVGVRVGDSIVFTDFVGEESPSLTFVARTHARRPIPVPRARPSSPMFPTTRCIVSSISPVPSRQAQSNSSSPSSPKSVRADWLSTVESRWRTRAP